MHSAWHPAPRRHHHVALCMSFRAALWPARSWRKPFIPKALSTLPTGDFAGSNGNARAAMDLYRQISKGNWPCALPPNTIPCCYLQTAGFSNLTVLTVNCSLELSFGRWRAIQSEWSVMLLRACHESARLVSFLCILISGSVLTLYFQVSLLLSRSQGRPARLGRLMMLPQGLPTRVSRRH